MSKITFKQLAIEVLQASNRPMTKKQMWDFAVTQGWHKRLNTFDENTGRFSGATPFDTFTSTMHTNKNDFQEVSNTKPKQYRLKNNDGLSRLSNDLANDWSNDLPYTTLSADNKTPTNSVKDNRNLKDNRNILQQINNTKPTSDFKERDLHPILCYFLKNSAYFNAYAKTIFHESSTKGVKGADRWLYPDMVAVNFEYATYQKNNVLNFIKKFDILPIKIFSFELKKELNFSNYKESFFQAVSNSSWANEGYLVAYDIHSDNQFIEALQKLSQSFGIGVIRLDLNDVTQSQIISPAKFKEKMDYSVVDELASKSKHFKDFLKTVIDFDLSNLNRFLNEFDVIYDDDKLNECLKALKNNKDKC